MRLENGSQVAIVGGGPSGSFTALHLLQQAADANLDIKVTIFEARDFCRAGPGGCNKCAGILSSALMHNLKQLDLEIPLEVIQAELDTYVLHAGKSQLPIHLPDPGRKIISVYRGGGPLKGSKPYPASFDFWLQDQALLRGAEIRKTRVQSIKMAPYPQVITPREALKADLVVLATGVNSRLRLDPALEYQPPRTEVMAQDEIPLPTKDLDNKIHIYFDYPAGLIFGGLIPKGRYTSVSLLGHHLEHDAVKQFLHYNGYSAVLPEATASLCGCTPRVAVTTAKGIFSDRFVAVGDAAVTRLYKDGIGSAFLTAEAAAKTAVRRGISRHDFEVGYEPACQQISQDNFYGKLLFRLWTLVRQSQPIQKIWIRAIRNEEHLPPKKRIHTFILWGMFTGDASYRKMFWQLFSLLSWAGLFRGITLGRDR